MVSMHWGSLVRMPVFLPGVHPHHRTAADRALSHVPAVFARTGMPIGQMQGPPLTPCHVPSRLGTLRTFRNSSGRSITFHHVPPTPSFTLSHSTTPRHLPARSGKVVLCEKSYKSVLDNRQKRHFVRKIAQKSIPNRSGAWFCAINHTKSPKSPSGAVPLYEK